MEIRDLINLLIFLSSFPHMPVSKTLGKEMKEIGSFTVRTEGDALRQRSVGGGAKAMQALRSSPSLPNNPGLCELLLLVQTD